MILLIQTLRFGSWHTVDYSFTLEEAFDKADDFSRIWLYGKIRVFEPAMRATYYGPELKEIIVHGLKIR